MHAEIDLDSGQIHASSGSTVQRLRVYIDRLKSIEDCSGEILPYLDDEGHLFTESSMYMHKDGLSNEGGGGGDIVDMNSTGDSRSTMDRRQSVQHIQSIVA